MVKKIIKVRKQFAMLLNLFVNEADFSEDFYQITPGNIFFADSRKAIALRNRLTRLRLVLESMNEFSELLNKLEIEDNND